MGVLAPVQSVSCDTLRFSWKQRVLRRSARPLFSLKDHTMCPGWMRPGFIFLNSSETTTKKVKTQGCRSKWLSGLSLSLKSHSCLILPYNQQMPIPLGLCCAPGECTRKRRGDQVEFTATRSAGGRKGCPPGLPHPWSSLLLGMRAGTLVL